MSKCGPDSSTVYYFAIGAMMNPISLASRGLVPIQSAPAELLDFRLRFFGPRGMAYAEKQTTTTTGKKIDADPPPSPFFGVLHELSTVHCAKLDKIEFTYARLPAKAKLLKPFGMKNADETVDCFVYGESGEKGGVVALSGGRPEERYIDVLCEGCDHFGVPCEHAAYLRNLDYKPRPETFRSISFAIQSAHSRKSRPLDLSARDDFAKVWSLNEFRRACGVHKDGDPRIKQKNHPELLFLVNNLVLEWVGPLEPRSIYSFLSVYIFANTKEEAGVGNDGGNRDGEDKGSESDTNSRLTSTFNAQFPDDFRQSLLLFARFLYDPVYGLPEHCRDMSAAHRASVEHGMVESKMMLPNVCVRGLLLAEGDGDKMV